MYKMKDVCKMTGLTEKAIRLYMEQKLVEPKVEEGIHRNSYSFEEKDVERLKDIATLRSAGFGIADIKMMIEDPTNISSLVEEKESLLKSEIEHMKSLRQTINRLTIVEHSDVTKLADAIEPRSTHKKETPKISRGIRRLIVSLIIFIVLLIPVILNGTSMLEVYAGGFGISLGTMALIAGLRYFLHGGKTKKRECKGVGTIVSVVTSDKIEDYIMNEEEKKSHDFAKLVLFGIGGMAIWESLRLDCWYPVIRYEDQDGNHQIATVRHGAFKRTWKIGDTIDIAWDKGKEKLVYECKKKGIHQKAWSYLIPAIIMLVIGVNIWIPELKQAGIIGTEPTQPIETETRELTAEENEKLLDILETLWVVNNEEWSFISSNLSNTEVLHMAYKMTVDVVYKNNVSAFQATELEEVARECFNYKLKIENKIYCECGEVEAEYDGHTMMKINMKHTHKVNEDKVEMIYKYEDSYYDNGNYVIIVYKAPKSNPEEKIHCSYVFARDEKGESVLGMQDFEYYLVSYNRM